VVNPYKVFNELDRDGDMKISMDEAVASGFDAAIFKELDVNGDGRLSIKELSIFLKKEGKQWAEKASAETARSRGNVSVFNKLDLDGDMRISMEEAAALGFDAASAFDVATFKGLDVNGDGKLSIKELSDFLPQPPQPLPRQSNEDIACDLFNLQANMAVGGSTGASMSAHWASRGSVGSSSFANSFELKVNPKAEPAGPSCTGSFTEVMEVLGTVWEGFVNTKVVNVNFKEVKVGHRVEVPNGEIVITQKYDNHLATPAGIKIEASANKWLVVINSVMFNAEGKITAWIQEFDHVKVQNSRDAARVGHGVVALATETMQLQKTLKMGHNFEMSKKVKFTGQFAQAFAHKITMQVNPGDAEPGPSATGPFGIVQPVISRPWLDIINTSVENVEIGTDVGSNDVEVTQKYTFHLLNDAGKKVAATENKDFEVKHIITYNENKQIVKWVQNYDKSILNTARAQLTGEVTDIVALTKEIFELQKSTHVGSELASHFTPKMTLLVNPKDREAGPKSLGSFGEAVTVLGTCWAGFVTTKVNNANYKKISKTTVVLTQAVDAHIPDGFEEPTSGSELKWFRVVNTITFSNGLISKWIQEYDGYKVAEAKAAGAGANPE
jgi:Ca2+-binding EF-hand superfamily protein